MQGKVRCVVGQVQEPRLFRSLARVRQKIQRVICQRIGPIEGVIVVASRPASLRQPQVPRRIPKRSRADQRPVELLESMQRRIVRSHMPLTRHEGPVACRFQHLRDRCRILREPAPVSRLSKIRDHVPDSYFVRVLPRENARPRRTAPGGGIELRKAHSAGSQLVQVRRVDLSAKAAQVAIAQIIGHDQQDVWTPLLLDGKPHDRG